MRFNRILVTLFAVFLLAFSLIPAESFARGGSFGGGGGRSFGGGFSGGRSFGGGSRSFSSSGSRSFSGGGSFNRSSSGSFGSRSFSSSSGRATSPSFGGQRSTSSSFQPSGGFGSSGRVTSTSINPSPKYGYRGAPSYSQRIYVNGGYYPSYGYGFMSGYSFGMLTNPWTHWVPFHPAFYYNPPIYDDGAYYSGGFSFFRLIMGLAVIAFVIWLIARIFRGFGGGKGVRYTNYQ